MSWRKWTEHLLAALCSFIRDIVYISTYCIGFPNVLSVSTNTSAAKKNRLFIVPAEHSAEQVKCCINNIQLRWYLLQFHVKKCFWYYPPLGITLYMRKPTVSSKVAMTIANLFWCVRSSKK